MESSPRSAEEWLDAEEKACRRDRLQRLTWLVAHAPIADYWAFPGGWLAKYLFEEARYCFVYGQFLAATLLGFAFVERTLVAILYGGGRDDLERANVSGLLREALSCGWITQDQFAALDRARQLRNAVAHFRPPLDQCSVEYRSVAGDRLPYEVVEKDAEFVLEGGLEILRRNLA